MRGAILPAALLCLAFVFMLAFAPGRTRLPAILAAAATLLLGLVAVWPPQYHEAAFLLAWASVIAISASVHLPQGSKLWNGLAPVFGALTGTAVTAVVAYEGTRGDLVRVLPVLSMYFVARLLIGRSWGIVIKIVASWLIAVAILGALLPLAPTPGYVKDHME